MSIAQSALPLATSISPDDQVAINQQSGGRWTTRRAPLRLMVAGDLIKQSIAGTAYTLVAADLQQRMLVSENASATTITIPNDTVLGLTDSKYATYMPNLLVYQNGAGQVGVSAGSGVTLRTASTAIARARYAIIGLVRVGVNEWAVVGDLA